MVQPIQQIDFYFDFPSPYSYLASTQLPKLAENHGVTIAYRPFRILEAMKTARPGQKERELAAVADYVFRKDGAQGVGYFALVAAGLAALSRGESLAAGVARIDCTQRVISRRSRRLPGPASRRHPSGRLPGRPSSRRR